MIALLSVAGCQTGSVKGQVKTFGALSILLPDTGIAPTELKVKVDAVVKTVGVNPTSQNFNGLCNILSVNSPLSFHPTLLLVPPL